jgi:hypothetical protein
MLKGMRRVHIALEVVGGLAIAGALGWLAIYAISWPFRHFTDGDCSPDTEQRMVSSPDGQHTVKSFHRSCGSTYDFYFAYLSTSNPNPGYEYEPILELKNVAAGQASIAWEGSDQLTVTYPNSAEVVDASAKTFGVTIVLHPIEAGTNTGAK